ncbi:MAG: hypothetical protein MR269_05955 [Clostridiales bacterium]|nr:hypothetical protein [Clostridiales bacterium]MDY4060921.1 hypothetical protein [Anaerovoracaceae bacterium]
MAAENNLTVQTTKAQNIDFVNQFGKGIAKLQELMRITRLLPMPVGTIVKTYKSVVTLDGTKYGKLPLIGHTDVAATAYPGRYYAMLGTIKSMAEAVYAGQKVQAVNVPQAKPRHQIAVNG